MSNGDGKPDLIVGNNSADGISGEGNVAVLLGNGDGTFQTAVTYDSGGQSANSVAVSDVNSDGRPDLLVSNQCIPDNCFNGNGVLGVLLGNGDGTFQPVVLYGSGAPGANSIAVADVNSDGRPDLLVANNGSNTVGVLLGNGDGTFKPVVTYGSGFGAAWALSVADVNGDGNTDVLVTHFFDGTVGVLLGNRDGTFRTAVTYNSGGSSPGSIVTTDVDGDGKPDVLVSECAITGCDNGNEVGVLLNNSPVLDTTPPLITVSATPKVLWPPNGKMVPVSVSGTITDTGSGVNTKTAAYSVRDEYGEVQPTRAIALGPGGNYSFTVLLQASRRGSDLDGRRYTITVRAKDNVGNGGSKTSAVTVPHDQGD
jgi:VCBS repeat protein